jgi:hypothetical protein
MNEEPSPIHRGQNSNAAELLPATLIAPERLFHGFLRWLNNRYQFPRSAQFREPTSIRGHRLTEDYRWQPFFIR